MVRRTEESAEGLSEEEERRGEGRKAGVRECLSG